MPVGGSTASTDSKLLWRRAVELPAITGPLGLFLLYRGLDSWTNSAFTWAGVAVLAGGLGWLLDRLAGDRELNSRQYAAVLAAAVPMGFVLVALVPVDDYSTVAGVFVVICGAVLAVPSALELLRRRRSTATPTS